MKVTFQKDIIPNNVHKVQDPFIPNLHIVVECDSPQTRQGVKVWLTVAQCVFPALTVPLDLLVL